MAMTPAIHENPKPIGITKTVYSNKTVSANNRAWIANITSSRNDNDIVWVETNNSIVIPYLSSAGDGTLQCYIFNTSNAQQTADVTVYFGSNVMV